MLPPASSPNPFSHGSGSSGENAAAPAGRGRYASKARDIFSDIDYKDYIAEPSPSLVKSVKDLADELMWKYSSVLMAQPFEVAKTILQVRSQGGDDDAAAAVAAAAAAAAAATKQASDKSWRQGHGRSSAYDQGMGT